MEPISKPYTVNAVKQSASKSYAVFASAINNSPAFHLHSKCVALGAKGQSPASQIHRCQRWARRALPRMIQGGRNLDSRGHQNAAQMYYVNRPRDVAPLMHESDLFVASHHSCKHCMNGK